MPRLAPLALLALAACTELPGEDEGGTLGYDEPAEIAPSDTRGGDTIRYGVTAADCDADNRYMTEFVEISDAGLTDRGTSHAVTDRKGDRLTLANGETILLDEDALVRWPDDPAQATVYRRCD